MRNLEQSILNYVKLPEAILIDVTRHFEKKEIKKDEYVLRQGRYMSYYYFVEKGGLRIFTNHENKQITAWLSFENNFLVDIASVNAGTPSIYNIQTIEDSVLYAINSDEMNKLYKKYPEWQEFGRKLWEKAFLQVVDGMMRYQTMSAEERYLHLLKQSDAIQRVPLKQLSSFLGITPTSLSRLRKKIQ